MRNAGRGSALWLSKTNLPSFVSIPRLIGRLFSSCISTPIFREITSPHLQLSRNTQTMDSPTNRYPGMKNHQKRPRFENVQPRFGVFKDTDLSGCIICV